MIPNLRNSIAPVLLLASGAVPSWCQWSQQIAQRGFVQGTAFDVSTLDSVDTVNGNVVIRIPLAAMPAGHAGMGANVTLTYNSGMYDSAPGYYADPSSQTVTSVSGNLEFAGLGDIGGIWSYGYNYGIIREQRAPEPVFVPGGDFPGVPLQCVVNGQGVLDTGQTSDSALRPVSIHAVFPDGSSHVLVLTTTPSPLSQYPYAAFYSGSDGWGAVDELGFPEGCLAGQRQQTFPLNYITTDGTFVRVTVTREDPSSNSAAWIMMFPDGKKVTGSGMMTDHIYDRNGNFVAMTQTDQSGACFKLQGVSTDMIKTLKDNFGRCVQIEHGLSSDWITQVGAQGGSSCSTNVTTGCLITKVNFTAVGVEFDVPETGVGGVCHFGFGCQIPGNPDPCQGQPCPVNLITQVSGVDLSQAGFTNPLSFSVDYNNGDTTCQRFSAQTPCQGQVTKITLPHGSSIATAPPTIQYVFNPAGLIEPQDMPILSKTLTHYDPYTSDQRTDTWHYNLLSPSGGVNNSVTNPDGSITNYYAFFEAPTGTNLNGHTFKVDRLDASGALLSRTEQFWQFNVDPNGQTGISSEQVNPFVKAEVRSVAPTGTASPTLAAITINTMDVNGNNTRADESDWVNYSNVSHTNYGDIEQLPSIAATRSTVSSYYVLADAGTNGGNAYWKTSAPAILDAKKSLEVLGNGAATSYSEFIYDDATGAGANPTSGAANVTQEWQWDSTRAAFPGATSSGDSTNHPLTLSATNAIVTNKNYNSGDLHQEIDPRGNEKDIEYSNDSPYPTDLYEGYGTPIALHWHFGWDPSSGLRTSETDPNGAVTTANYYLRGRPHIVNQAGLRQTTTTYNDAAQTVQVQRQLDSAGDSVQSISTTDDLGHVWNVQSTDGSCAAGIQTVDLQQTPAGEGFSYKLTSNPFCATTDPTMGWTRTKLDPAGRVVEIAHFAAAASLPSPWGNTTTAGSGSASTSYNANQYTMMDENSISRTMTTDGMNRLSSVSDGTGVTTSYVYNALDDLTDVYQSAQHRSFLYTSLGRLQTATNPESGQMSYTWDDAGNLATRVDARSITTTSGRTPANPATVPYDALNRIVMKTYTDGTPTVTYCYDGQTYGGTAGQCAGNRAAPFLGRLTQVTATDPSTGNLISAFGYTNYDSVGRVVASSQSTGGSTFPFSYAYNMLDGLTQEVYPSGRVINYGYDSGGRVSTVSGMFTQNGAIATTPYAGTLMNPITYAPHHVVSKLPLGSGLTEVWSYNDRLQQIGITASNAQLANELTLNFYPCDGGSVACSNNNGNIWRETISAPNLSGLLTQEYRYDSVNRLTVAIENPAAAVSQTSTCTVSLGGNWCQQFGYDVYGNRWVGSATGLQLATNTPQSSDGFGAGNHLTANGAQPDASGNLSQIGGAGGQGFTYDGENRLKSVTSGGSTTVSYVYDGEGRRVQKVVGTTATTYVYDSRGDLASEYVNNPPVAPCVTCYVTTDHLGSTRMMTDGNGNAVALHDYEPFGEEIPGAVGGRNAGLYGVADDPRQKFTGKERDSETANSADPNGLDFFGARYFSSAQGRFTSPDWSATPQPVPYADLTDPQTLNLYSYVRNNPLRKADPDGHCGFIGGDDTPCSASQFFSSLPDRVIGGLKGEANLFFGTHLTPSNAEQAEAMNTVKEDGPTIVGYGAMVLPGPRGEGGELVPGEEAPSGKPGSYAPDRPLPRDSRTGNVIPETNPDGSAAGAHTQLGTKVSSRGAGKYTQAREFDQNGKPVKDIHFTDHNEPDKHPNPHQHVRDPKTGKIGPAEPFQ